MTSSNRTSPLVYYIAVQPLLWDTPFRGLKIWSQKKCSCNLCICYLYWKDTYNGGQKLKNFGLCEKTLPSRTLLLMTIFWSPLGTSHRPPTPTPPAMLCPKKQWFHPFAQNSTLFGVGGEGSLVSLILLKRSQHFWPPVVASIQIQPPFREHIHVCTQKVTEVPL